MNFRNEDKTVLKIDEIYISCSVILYVLCTQCMKLTQVVHLSACIYYDQNYEHILIKCHIGVCIKTCLKNWSMLAKYNLYGT
jgi:hypothetical protein